MGLIVLLVAALLAGMAGTAVTYREWHSMRLALVILGLWLVMTIPAVNR